MFLTIALWHLYMAWSPRTGANGSVPSVDGRPLFVPSAGATILVLRVKKRQPAACAAIDPDGRRLPAYNSNNSNLHGILPFMSAIVRRGFNPIAL